MGVGDGGSIHFVTFPKIITFIMKSFPKGVHYLGLMTFHDYKHHHELIDYGDSEWLPACCASRVKFNGSETGGEQISQILPGYILN